MNPHDFSLCVLSFCFSNLKQKPCLCPLRLDWQTSMSSFFALDLDLSTYCDHTGRLLVTLGKKTGKKKWWLSNWGWQIKKKKTSPLWGSLWSLSNQRMVTFFLLVDPVRLCIPLKYLFVHLFPTTPNFWGQGLCSSTLSPQQLAQGLSTAHAQWMMKVYTGGGPEGNGGM